MFIPKFHPELINPKERVWGNAMPGTTATTLSATTACPPGGDGHDPSCVRVMAKGDAAQMAPGDYKTSSRHGCNQ